MQDSDDDMVGLGSDGGIDNEKIAAENSGIQHGLILRTDEKCYGRAADQMQAQIKLALDMVIGVAWNPAGTLGL